MSRRNLSILAFSAALSLAACSGGGGATTAPAASAGGGSTAACAPSTEAGTIESSMEGIAFVPSTIDAKVGDVITWTNKDGVPHTATSRDDPACTTPNLGLNESGALTFSVPGSYAFFCKIHADMTGTIEVTS